MNRKRRNTLILAFLAALGAVALLMTASRTGPNTKHDRPMGPDHSATASLAPSPDPLDAVPATTKDDEEQCSDLLDKGVVEHDTKQKPITVFGTQDTNVANDWYNLLCSYDSPTGKVVAQASYEKLKPLGLQYFKLAADHKDPSLVVTSIPASQKPFGVTSAFYFSPARSAWSYHYPGAQMLVGDDLVTISVKGFDHMSPGHRTALMNNALKDVIK